MATYLTLIECAEKLKVSRSKIERLIRDGELIAVKLGRGVKSAVRVSEADLDAFVQAHRGGAGPVVGAASS